MHPNIKSLFMLDENITYLNHGSFGACPKPIFESLQKYQTQLETQPVQFLDVDSQALMIKSRNCLADFIDCNPENLVFFQNPTTAINEIVRSIQLNKNDEILSTNHEYGAMDKTWDFICRKTGAKHIKSTIQLPVKDAQTFTDNFLAGVTSNTKIFFLSHMTSATGLYFPLDEICKFAKKHNILTIIDGAHIPGHFPLSINTLQPDIYVGACHKWLLCPKGVSFLYVDKKYQSQIDPLVISWGYDSEYPIEHSEFQIHHYWQGTRDVSPFLTIPDAIQFRENYNWEEVSKKCKLRILEFKNEIHQIIKNQSLVGCEPDKWLGQMYSFQLDNEDFITLKNIFITDYKIEIPIMRWENKTLMRISLNGYNSEENINKLIDILKKKNY
ncbi:MAG: aminotransferase [Candidatus Marinimicrobia bacterium]|nr:aminotransferase [Candidatus Neomarinimicrobiota bacterium]